MTTTVTYADKSGTLHLATFSGDIYSTYRDFYSRTGVDPAQTNIQIHSQQ